MSILNVLFSDYYKEKCTSNCTFKPMHVGEKAIIELPSNKSTGFNWSLDASNGLAEIEAINEVPCKPKRIGCGGVTQFLFNTISVGTARLEFLYQRSFSEDVTNKIIVKIPIHWPKGIFSSL